MGDDVKKISKLTEELDGLTFDERRGRLERMARQCSDCNETQCGSGDDATIMHIRFKGERKR